MRTRRTLLNSATAVGSYTILLFMSLFTRRMFVINFDTNLLGYAGVIENIFGLLAVTELGVGSVITYHLYRELGEKSRERLSMYLSLYRRAYQAIGLVILAVALALIPFLPWMIPDPGTDWQAVAVIYGLQCLNTVSTYFLSFRRILYTTEQRGYVCTRIDLVCSVTVNVLRLVIATWWPNYLAYYGVATAGTIVANLLIARRFRLDYPDIVHRRVTWADFKALGMLADLKTYLVHRLSNAVYGSIDNIVISRVLGTLAVSRVSNYTTIQNRGTDFLSKMLDGFASGIGSLVYDKEAKARAEGIFWSLDLMSYYLACLAAVGYLCALPPFIRFWLPGSGWVLPTSYLVFFCLNEYVGWNHRMLGSFRGVLGHFEADMNYMIAAAIVNLVLSFVLVASFGLGGVVAATVAAHCLMWAGRAHTVFTLYLPGRAPGYLRRQAVRAAVLAGEMALGYAASLRIQQSVSAFGGLAAAVLSGLVAVGLVTLVTAVLFLPTRDAAYLRARAGDILAKARRKADA